MEVELLECGDDDLIAVMQQSVIEEIRKKQDEKEKKHKEKVAAEKLAVKAEAAK